MLLLPQTGHPHHPHAKPRRVEGRLRRWAAAVASRAPGGWTGLAVGALLLATLLPGDRGLFRLVGLVRDRASLRTELRQLALRRAALEEELRRLTTDPETIERLARERLDLARRGETVYKFPAVD